MLKRKKLAVVTVILAGSGAVQAQGALLLQYKFDESSSGTTPALDTGSSPAANGAFSGTATRTSNTPGGVSLGAMSTGSGGATDYVTGGDANKLDSLATMTVTGWINLQAAPALNDRLVSKLLSSGGNFTGWDLRFNTAAGQLSFSIINNNGGTPSGNSTVNLSTAPGWQFFGVSYDGSNVRYFTGGVSTPASQLGASIATPTGFATPADTTADVRVGSTAATTSDRTPTAFFDDIRVYDNAMTTTAEFEAVRAANVPEPTGLGLAVLGAAGLLLRRRSRASRVA